MIPINENFEKAYKDSMAKGFTVKELFAVFSAAASLAVVCVVCFLSCTGTCISPSFWGCLRRQ